MHVRARSSPLTLRRLSLAGSEVDHKPALPSVLLVMTQASFRSDGGVRSATQLALSAHRRGVRIDVVTSREGEVNERLRRAGMDVRVVTHLQHHGELGARGLVKRAVATIRCNLAVFAILRAASPKYDVVQTNDRRAFWSSVFATKVASVPIIDVVRDTEVRVSAYRRFKWRTGFRLASVVIVLSNDMLQRWQRTIGVLLPNFTHLYSIVDFEVYRPPTPDEKLKLRHELDVSAGPAIVYAAGFRSKKGQLEFIVNALRHLLDRIPTAKVYFVGDFEPGSDAYASACLEAVRNLGLQSSVSFEGHSEHVDRWYRAADVVVLASEREGLARSMIESVSCGTPVVSFAVSSATEVLERFECGTVVRMFEYEKLADAVAALCSDSEMRAVMGRNGVKAARLLFSSDAVVEEYLRILEKTTEARPEEIHRCGR